jgi:hypothetical protein
VKRRLSGTGRRSTLKALEIVDWLLYSSAGKYCRYHGNSWKGLKQSRRVVKTA